MSAVPKTGSTITAAVHKALNKVMNLGEFVISGLGTTERSPPDMYTRTAAGVAFVNGARVETTTYTDILHTADPTLPRINLIVMGDDAVIDLVAGTPASPPSPPATPSGHYKLCEVYVAAGATSITNANITDKREYMPLVIISAIAPASPKTGDLRYETGWLKYEETSWRDIAGRLMYIGDETEKSVTGTGETEIKFFRPIYSSDKGRRYNKLYFVAELRVSGGTGSLKVSIDGAASVTIGSTTSTSYVVVEGSVSVSWSENSVHTVSIRLVNSGSYVTYNRVLEVWTEWS